MNKGRILIAGLFLLPSLALICAIVQKKRVGDPILITASELRQTQAAWTNQTYVAIETNADFAARIKGLPVRGNGVSISAAGFASLRQTCLNLVLANFLGDYSQYKKFRVPSSGFDRPSETASRGWKKWYQAVFPNDPVPDSFDEITGKIWNKVYGNRHYWLSIGFDKSYISLLATNQIPGALPIDMADPDNFHCMESISRGTYSYDSAVSGILMREHELKMAKINLWVDTADPTNRPRPYMYVMVLDSSANCWLPVEVAQCSTSGSKYPAPF